MGSFPIILHCVSLIFPCRSFLSVTPRAHVLLRCTLSLSVPGQTLTPSPQPCHPPLWWFVLHTFPIVITMAGLTGLDDTRRKLLLEHLVGNRWPLVGRKPALVSLLTAGVFLPCIKSTHAGDSHCTVLIFAVNSGHTYYFNNCKYLGA